MKSATNLSELFEKLDDLKTVFRYGEKLIPVIQGLVDFMRDTVPLLENINSSISESTSKIPKATNQISNVTSATELATTEILDIIDIISNDISTAETAISSLIKIEKEKVEILSVIKTLVGGNEKVDALFERYEKINYVNPILAPLTELLEKTRTNVYNITLSLQVQDITAQQLASVNHLIESVQERLTSLVIDFEVTNVSVLDSSVIQVPQNTTFDPNARYSKSVDQQDAADELVKDHHNRTSQDEIDKLFS
ncbi:MAG: protein phosphatase CheZ [Ignavibacteria bacterium]|nr:protein phosphatase CheZ [Ignavibacteria bacterium]